MLGMAPAPIAVVSDNRPCFSRGGVKTAVDGPDPPLRTRPTQVRSPQTNGVIERWFGTLNYEQLFRGMITDGDALDMEIHDSASSTTRSDRTRPSAIEHPARPTQVVTSKTAR
jgi:putative transposase